MTSFDFYSNGTAWIQEQPFRIPEAIINGAEYIHRISLMGNGEDAVIVVKDQGNGRKSLSIYRQNGNFVCRNDEILNEANSEFVAVVAANLVAEVNGDGDPDELIVIRKLKSNGNLIPDVYKLNFPVRGSLKADFISLSGDGIQIISFLESCLNKKGFRFCGMTGIRRNTFLHKDKRRDLDSMAFIREDEEEGTILAGICNFENHNQLIFRENYIKCKLSEQFFVTSMDIDMDRQEEIITARTEGDKVGLGIYKLKGCALELQHIKWLKNGIKSGTPVCLTSISRYIPVNIF